MDIRSTVDQIFAHLTELKRPVVARRRQGLDAEAAKTKLQSFGLVASQELLTLYGVCDGTDTAEGDMLDQIQFFPGYYWMGLDEALATYSSLMRGGGWNLVWLPIFASGGGDFYAVVCDETSADFGGLVGFILGETDHLVEFQNVATMMQTIERAFAERELR